jgi:hypothetical protein
MACTYIFKDNEGSIQRPGLDYHNLCKPAFLFNVNASLIDTGHSVTREEHHFKVGRMYVCMHS